MYKILAGMVWTKKRGKEDEQKCMVQSDTWTKKQWTKIIWTKFILD